MVYQIIIEMVLAGLLPELISLLAEAVAVAVIAVMAEVGVAEVDRPQMALPEQSIPDQVVVVGR